MIPASYLFNVNNLRNRLDIPRDNKYFVKKSTILVTAKIIFPRNCDFLIFLKINFGIH